MSVVVDAALHSAFGATVTGLDVTEPLPEAVVADLKALIDKHHLILVRGSERCLEPKEQQALMAHFGEVETWLAGMDAGPDPNARGVFRTVNKPSGTGAPELINAGTTGWHHDGLYRGTPTNYVSYHIIQVASSGGDTLFAQAQLAYEALPSKVRDRLEQAWAIHGYQDPQKVRHGMSAHRLVRPHPRTGRMGLYLGLSGPPSPGTLIVLGMSPDERADVFGYLDEFLRSDELMYRHRWEPRDLLLGDNISLLHIAEVADLSTTRVMHRVTVAGKTDYTVQQSFTP